QVLLLRLARKIVELHLPEFDAFVHAELVCGPACLREIVRVHVDRGDAGAARGQLEAVEAGIAADVKHPPTVQVGGNVRFDLAPLEGRKVAEEVVGRGLHAIGQMQVVEPRRERGDRVPCHVPAGRGRGNIHSSRSTNLKKRLGFPSAVFSWYRNARSASSNLSKNSSQSIASRSSLSVKAMRRMPASSSSPVPRTVAGLPPRASTQRRISP